MRRRGGGLRGLVGRHAGLVGAVGALGIAAAGVAVGVATERYLVKRTRAGRSVEDDPFVDEPFGDLPCTERFGVHTPDDVELYVEVVEADPQRQAGTIPLDSGRLTAGSTGPRSLAADVTLVFVHGFCLDMGTFHFQRQALAGEYRMVFYDQPGHGRSGRRSSGEYTLDALGAALRAVLDKAAPGERVVLIGHSMGGMAIMALAEQAPELFADRVAGVVLISTSAGRLNQVTFGLPDVVARFQRPLLPVVRNAGRLTTGMVDRARRASRDLAYLLTRRYGFGTDPPSPSLVSYVERMNSTTTTEVIARYVHTLHTHARHLALATLRPVPVLVVCGDTDALTPLAHSHEIVRALPDAELVVIEGGGHVALLQHADQVNAALRGFLQRVAR